MGMGFLGSFFIGRCVADSTLDLWSRKLRNIPAQFLYNTDEEIREEWELQYIANKRRGRKEEDE
jgi:hypothetical protein